MPKTLLLPVLTFVIGLGTGALVFSEPRPTAPPDAPAVSAGPLTAPDTGTVAAVRAASTPVTAAPDAAPAPAETETEPAVAALPEPAREQLASLMDGWGRMQAELAELRARVVTLEQRPLPAVAEPGPVPADAPDRERQALVRAGLPPAQADDIINRRAQVALDRLELRDLAIREGWLGSDRYREALREVNAREVSLSDELDPFAYDRYLYESGAPNRVQVQGVIPGSAGAESGLQPGDLIESYGDQRIFDYRELRQATSAGERGELVPVQVRRGDEVLEVWLPRGPIGIQLDSARVAP